MVAISTIYVDHQVEIGVAVLMALLGVFSLFVVGSEHVTTFANARSQPERGR